MKNKKFSFVRWITKKDIEKLVKLLGYEIVPNIDEDDLKYRSIRRFKDEKGHYHIHVECKDLITIETKKHFAEIISETETFKDLMRRGGLFAAALAATLVNYSTFSELDNIIILDITDFYIEELSLKSPNLIEENSERMTKEYRKYMVEKFGRFYNGMKSAALKKLYKEVREEEAQNKEAEQTKENNEEQLEK